MNEHVALLVESPEDSSVACSVPVEKEDLESVNVTSDHSTTTPFLLKEHSSSKEIDNVGSARNGHAFSHWEHDFTEGGDDLQSLKECRICQEEDDLSNLESPCACTGSLKFAHRECVQHWCNEKGDTICEICCKPYQGGYTAPPTSARANNFAINIGNSWDIASGQRLHLHEPALFTVTSDQHFLEAEYEEYRRANARSAACFRAVAVILMVILVLRHVLSITTTVAEEDASTFVMLFFLRTAGFFLPCYIVARALNALHCRHQGQDSVDEQPEVATYIIQTRPTETVRIVVSQE